MDDCGSVAVSMIYISVSVANIFVHSSTAVDHRYHSVGELARFFYRLLQNIKGFVVPTGRTMGRLRDPKSFAVSCD